MRLNVIKVIGSSMEPTIGHASYVLTFKSRFTQFQTGDIIAIDHAQFGRIIKRIADIDINNRVLLSGDNHTCSTPSETMGWNDASRIVGKVVMQSAKPN